jgi:hypothetical protein
VLIADPATELDDTGVIDVDPVVVVADRPERSPDAKVVSRHELCCSTLVRHAVRVEVNDLTPPDDPSPATAPIATDARATTSRRRRRRAGKNYDDDRWTRLTN